MFLTCLDLQSLGYQEPPGNTIGKLSSDSINGIGCSDGLMRPTTIDSHRFTVDQYYIMCNI